MLHLICDCLRCVILVSRNTEHNLLVSRSNVFVSRKQATFNASKKQSGKSQSNRRMQLTTYVIWLQQSAHAECNAYADTLLLTMNTQAYQSAKRIAFENEMRFWHSKRRHVKRAPKAPSKRVAKAGKNTRRNRVAWRMPAMLLTSEFNLST